VGAAHAAAVIIPALSFDFFAAGSDSVSAAGIFAALPVDLFLLAHLLLPMFLLLLMLLLLLSYLQLYLLTYLLLAL
jgi:hypothetical protein